MTHEEHNDIVLNKGTDEEITISRSGDIAELRASSAIPSFAVISDDGEIKTLWTVPEKDNGWARGSEFIGSLINCPKRSRPVLLRRVMQDMCDINIPEIWSSESVFVMLSAIYAYNMGYSYIPTKLERLKENADGSITGGITSELGNLVWTPENVPEGSEEAAFITGAYIAQDLAYLYFRRPDIVTIETIRGLFHTIIEEGTGGPTELGFWSVIGDYI